MYITQLEFQKLLQIFWHRLLVTCFVYPFFKSVRKIVKANNSYVMLCDIILYYIILYYIMLYYIILYYIILYYIILYYIILYYIIL